MTGFVGRGLCIPKLAMAVISRVDKSTRYESVIHRNNIKQASLVAAFYREHFGSG